MKKVLPFICACLLNLITFSQSPQGIPYQAVIHNSDGSPMVNSALTLTFKIHHGSPNGDVVFEENHALTSTAEGLVHCTVGSGIALQGTLAQVNWGDGPKFFHVLMGTTDLGVQQMMSVPYALHAANTSATVSVIGDTLTIGGHAILVPGISALNGGGQDNGGFGLELLIGNSTCSNQYISVTGCGGLSNLTYDNQIYNLVEIAGQCWFAENLNTDQFRNGDMLTTGLDNNSWQITGTGSFAIYNNDAFNEVAFGKLYNWYAVSDARGLCPTGWHVPTDCEWMYLENALGMDVFNQELTGFRGTAEGGALKSTNTWNSPNFGANNSSNFSALPGGYRYFSGTYANLNYNGYWWSSSEMNSPNAWYRAMSNNNATVGRASDSKRLGFNVRCIKD